MAGASEVDFGSGIELNPPWRSNPVAGCASILPGPGDGPADSEDTAGFASEETNEETPIVGDPNRFSEREFNYSELAERHNVLDAGTNWKNGSSIESSRTQFNLKTN